MFHRLRAYPMIVLLLPLVVIILVCGVVGQRYEALRNTPVNLLYESEFAELDSLRYYAFVIKSAPKHTARCERYEAKVLPRGRVLLYILRDSQTRSSGEQNTKVMPQTGDTLYARTRIRRPDSIGDFNYAMYLRRQGIIGTAFVSTYQLQAAAHATAPLRQRLYRRLNAAGLQGDELATTAAMTLGYKEDLDPTLRHHFQASGAAHVLAVSGLHTGIIYGILLWLLTLGGRFKPMYENRLGRCSISLVIIAAMWFYAWLTGMTPSVVRAVLMVTIFEVGRMAYRQAISLNTIAAAAVLILLVRPLDLWSVSFQLSFAATAAIVLMAREMEKVFYRRDWFKRWYGRVTSWVVGIIIISLAAQLGTLPLTMHYFGQISNYFLLTNLIVLPISSLLVPSGLIAVVLGGTWPGLLAGKVTYGLAWLMNHAVEWIESLPGSITQVSVGTGMVAIYYGMWLVFLILYANICTRQKKVISLQTK